MPTRPRVPRDTAKTVSANGSKKKKQKGKCESPRKAARANPPVSSSSAMSGSVVDLAATMPAVRPAQPEGHGLPVRGANISVVDDNGAESLDDAVRMAVSQLPAGSDDGRTVTIAHVVQRGEECPGIPMIEAVRQAYMTLTRDRTAASVSATVHDLSQATAVARANDRLLSPSDHRDDVTSVTKSLSTCDRVAGVAARVAFEADTGLCTVEGLVDSTVISSESALTTFLANKAAEFDARHQLASCDDCSTSQDSVAESDSPARRRRTVAVGVAEAAQKDLQPTNHCTAPKRSSGLAEEACQSVRLEIRYAARGGVYRVSFQYLRFVLPRGSIALPLSLCKLLVRSWDGVDQDILLSEQRDHLDLPLLFLMRAHLASSATVLVLPADPVRVDPPIPSFAPGASEPHRLLRVLTTGGTMEVSTPTTLGPCPTMTDMHHMPRANGALATDELSSEDGSFAAFTPTQLYAPSHPLLLNASTRELLDLLRTQKPDARDTVLLRWAACSFSEFNLRMGGLLAGTFDPGLNMSIVVTGLRSGGGSCLTPTCSEALVPALAYYNASANVGAVDGGLYIYVDSGRSRKRVNLMDEYRREKREKEALALQHRLETGTLNSFIEDLRHANATVNDALADAREQVAVLQHADAQNSRVIDTNARELRELEVRNAKLSSQSGKQTRELSLVEKTHDVTEQKHTVERQEYQSQNEALRVEVLELKASEATLRKQLDDARKCAETTRLLTASRDRDAAAAFEQTNTHNKSLSSRVASLEQEVQVLRARLHDTTAKVDHTTSAVVTKISEELCQQKSQHVTEAYEGQRRIATLEAQLFEEQNTVVANEERFFEARSVCLAQHAQELEDKDKAIETLRVKYRALSVKRSAGEGQWVRSKAAIMAQISEGQRLLDALVNHKREVKSREVTSSLLKLHAFLDSKGLSVLVPLLRAHGIVSVSVLASLSCEQLSDIHIDEAKQAKLRAVLRFVPAAETPEEELQNWLDTLRFRLTTKEAPCLAELPASQYRARFASSSATSDSVSIVSPTSVPLHSSLHSNSILSDPLRVEQPRSVRVVAETKLVSNNQFAIVL